jgi:hypothetical protein
MSSHPYPFGTKLVSITHPDGAIYEVQNYEGEGFYTARDDWRGTRLVVHVEDVMLYSRRLERVFLPGVHVQETATARARWRKGTKWFSVVRFHSPDNYEVRYVYPIAERPDWNPAYDSDSSRSRDGKKMWEHCFFHERSLTLRNIKSSAKQYYGFCVTEEGGLVHKANRDGHPLCYNHGPKAVDSSRFPPRLGVAMKIGGEEFSKKTCMTCQKTNAQRVLLGLTVDYPLGAWPRSGA